MSRPRPVARIDALARERSGERAKPGGHRNLLAQPNEARALLEPQAGDPAGQPLAIGVADDRRDDLGYLLGTFKGFHMGAGNYRLVRDCLVDGLRAVLALGDDGMTLRLARDLRALSRAHGVSIPEDLAVVIAESIDADES